jgi:DNA-binding NarL/FixJ family response regulator
MQGIVSFILLADHKTLLDLIAAALEQGEGMKCLGKFTSLGAFATLRPQSPPDVVMIDWRLCAGTSGELLRLLVSKLDSTRWLLRTDTPTPFVLKTAIAAGIRGCVAKSCDLAEVAKAIAALAAGGPYFCQTSQKALMAAAASPSRELTPTHISILRLVARGLEPKSIAARLGLANKTVYNHLGLIRERLAPHVAGGSLVDLARFARHQGIAVEE